MKLCPFPLKHADTPYFSQYIKIKYILDYLFLSMHTNLKCTVFPEYSINARTKISLGNHERMKSKDVKYQHLCFSKNNKEVFFTAFIFI